MTGSLYLLTRIAGRTLAFAAAEVDSVTQLGPITPAPCAAAGVLGLTALRSRVATVVDPRSALGLDDAGPAGEHAVVGTSDGHLYAILVRALEDVAAYEPMPVPAGRAAAAGRGGETATMIDRDGEPVLVVALSTLIPGAAARAA